MLDDHLNNKLAQKDRIRVLAKDGSVVEFLNDLAECNLQAEVIKDLKMRDWGYFLLRADSVTASIIDQTLFVIAAPGGVTLWVELNCNQNSRTPQQLRIQMMLKERGHRFGIIRSITEYSNFIKKNQCP